MATKHFTTTLEVEQSPNEIFKAITNVRGWWSEDIEGDTDKPDDEFSYHYEDVHYCKMKLIEVVPEKKVVWLVLDNHFNFIEDKNEWKGNKVVFEIVKTENGTALQFSQL